ncbi:MAG: hypothetical protein PF488_01770 [Patescibacteria group bacterium]|jgi:hypothetical protein|nr:hypothetical protein [Patescibacteria group bacterium]
MLKGLKIGFGFGLASAVITTLGLMVGLAASTQSKLAIIGGIVMIAIADSFSDSLGIHIAKESEGNFSKKQVWQATLFTLLFKMIFAASFLIPIIFLPIYPAIYVSLVWGAVVLIFQSLKLAENNNSKAVKVIIEHLAIATFVIVVNYYLGGLIANLGWN